MVICVLMLVVLCCGCVWLLLEKRRLNILTSNVATMAGDLPIVGHALMVANNRKDLMDFFRSASKQASENGGIIKFWLGSKLVIGVSNPKLFKKVVNIFMDKSTFYTFGESLFGDGLVISKGSIWKHHRKTINPIFHQHVLNSFLDVFNDTSLRLVKLLRERDGKQEFDPWPYISNNSLETAYQTIVGLTPDEQPVDSRTYAHALHNITESFVERGKHIYLYPNLFYNHSASKRKADECVTILKNVTKHAIHLKRKTKQIINTGINNKSDVKSLLNLLLEAEDKALFTEKEVIDELDNLMLAGYDTTATTLFFLLLTIGSYPRVQDKLEEELSEVFAGSLRDVTKGDLPRLVYLDAVVKETLRLYSIAPVVARLVSETVEIDGYVFPAGSELALLIDGMHRLKAWGEDVDQFRPERFLSREPGVDVADMFHPFSSGRRNCVGKQYAMMSLKVTLAHLLRNYRLSADVAELQVIFDVVLKPKSGFAIQIKSKYI